MALVLIRTVPNLAQPVKEYGPPKSILLLAFVETDMAVTPQFGVLQPLESK